MDLISATLPNITPWGSSLRARTVGRAAVYLESEDGRLWESARDALLVQQLNWCVCEDQTRELERLRIVLRAVAQDLHRIDPDSMIFQIFDGSRGFFEFYLQDLTSRQFVEHDAVVFKHARLSSLGWSVLALLEATKEPPVVGGTDAATAAILNAEKMLFA